MKPTLFVSDLHLSTTRPAQLAAFHRFCGGPALQAGEHLHPGRPVRRLDRRRPARGAAWSPRLPRRSRRSPTSGVTIGIVTGNRDFLLASASPRRPARHSCPSSSSSTPAASRRSSCTATSSARRTRLPALAQVSRTTRAGSGAISRCRRRFDAASRTGCAAAAGSDHRDKPRRSWMSSRAPSKPRFAPPTCAGCPWPHAPARAASHRRRRPGMRALRARRLVRPRQLPRIRRGGGAHARRARRVGDIHSPRHSCRRSAA